MPDAHRELPPRPSSGGLGANFARAVVILTGDRLREHFVRVKLKAQFEALDEETAVLVKTSESKPFETGGGSG